MNMISEGKLKADFWGFEITSNTDENYFLSSEIKNDIHKLVHNGYFRSYYTAPYEVKGKLFVFRVYFESGLLVSIILSPAGTQPSWNNVEESELVIAKAENDNWLRDKFSIAVPASYIWGTLESVIDKKGGMSSIVMRYKR